MDLGEAQYILGIKIHRDRANRLIGLCLDSYINKVLQRFRMNDSKKGNLPMRHGVQLSKSQCPTTSAKMNKMKHIPYASAIGSIMYAMLCTRPDVSYALSATSRYQANPGESHCIAVKGILKYLRRTKYILLLYGGDDELVVTGIDASFQTNKVGSSVLVKFQTTEANVVKPFTKALPQAKHDERTANIGLRQMSQWC
ncbi:hypothetical protein LIER_39917 [Lithospermum erythrorhizon]|uniref:Polyprotein n=1 Tax=Lithospermum erythrorhizon TaxID=34254 RepID=A0AAV3QQI3_LITER